MPLSLTESIANTVGIDGFLYGNLAIEVEFPNDVGIDGVLNTGLLIANAVEITAELDVGGVLLQYDTWRSVPRPDNMFFLICRTLPGDYDTDLTNLKVWTVDYDGLNEDIRILTPADNGWDSYSHPEWSPDGQEVVIAVETSTEYQLEIIDASGWN